MYRISDIVADECKIFDYTNKKRAGISDQNAFKWEDLESEKNSTRKDNFLV